MKKKLLTIAAVTALTAATAVPAMALENEFHGMYKFFAYESNFLNGTAYNAAQAERQLSDDSHSGFFAEQRARIMYTAKANDNLKLVTQFELDTRFGGIKETYKGAGNDSGNLDADQLTLETKNVYLDFNVLDTNFKVGMQPWADSYKSLFLLADMTGVNVTKKFDPLAVSLAWFRFDDNSSDANTTNGTPGEIGDFTADLIVADAKLAINKNLSVGVNYYNVQNDTGATNAPKAPKFDYLQMAGANVAAKFGPAAVDAFGAYQWGEFDDDQDISAYMFGATGKISVGAGAVNLAGFYLSGDVTQGTGDRGDFQTIAGAQTYFNPANMWLLVRNGQQSNTSTSVLGNDLTAGGSGLWGVFGGYEGKVNKLFYNANAGYAELAHAAAGEDKDLGIEVNAQVGYQLYDNLTASVAGAYLFIGDAAPDVDNVWMSNVQLSYAF